MDGDSLQRDMGIMCAKYGLRNCSVLPLSTHAGFERQFAGVSDPMGTTFVSYYLYLDVLFESIVCPLEKVLRIIASFTGSIERPRYDARGACGS